MSDDTSRGGGLAKGFIIATGLLLFAVNVVPYLGGYLMLDASSVDAEAVLQEVAETITTTDDGTWARRLRVTARLPGASQDVRPASLRVDRRTFDRLATGDAVRIRRHTRPWASALSRIDAEMVGQTWSARLKVWSEESWPLFHVLWSGWAGLLVLWLFGRGGGWGCLVPIVFTLVWLAYWLSPLSDEVPRGNTAVTKGTVVSVTLATKLGDTEDSGGFAVVAPYHMVVVEFTPAGARHAVKALDRIDEGSLPAAREGARVDVVYRIDAPRNARIVGGSRTYWWKNLFFWWPYAAAVAGFLGLWKLASRRWPWLARPSGRR
jgi:hypothetical protein